MNDRKGPCRAVSNCYDRIVLCLYLIPFLLCACGHTCGEMVDQGVLCGKTNVSGFPALGLSPSGSPTGHQKIVWTRSHSGRTHSGGWGGDWLFCRRIRRNRALALRGTQAVGSRARAATALVQSGRGIHAPVVQSSVDAGAPRAGAAKLRGRQVATFRTGAVLRPVPR